MTDKPTNETRDLVERLRTQAGARSNTWARDMISRRA